MKFKALLVLVTLILPMVAWSAERVVWLDELDISLIQQNWGTAKAGKAVNDKPMMLGGKTFEHGVGTHAEGVLYVALDGQAKRFQMMVGINDNAGGPGSASIKIYSDAALLFESPVFRMGDAPIAVDVDISGAKQIMLTIKDGGDDISYDHVNLADARFIVEGADPQIVSSPQEEAIILTPVPPKKPRINGPRIYGVRPGVPFIFRIPTTGERPIQFAAEELPEGLMLDADTGIITGAIKSETYKTYFVMLKAENAHGKAERELRIVAGDKLALTPPMGWNHWYAHYDRITDAMMREAADIMVSTGMADVGYQYVNIDDCWMNAPKNNDPMRVGPLRDDNGMLIPNKHFPDMNALTDYIHAKGLRAGTYISPGPLTCAGFAGSYKHEALDARTFADWGFDFLKYDWCSYSDVVKNKHLDTLKKTYIQMSALLREQSRDIVFNLCQYGMGRVWEWGEEVGGHCWRTSGDLGFELTRYHDVAKRNAEFHPHAHPGSWNDPDYLQIGFVGNANGMGEPKPCPLTPNEQYSYMSLWCLMAAPLFYSGDMTQLDAFTLNVLCNPEVIDINQDPLGKQGYPVFEKDDWEVWTKPLEDGSIAVGVFNRSEFAQEVPFTLNDAGLEGRWKLRDLWRQQDIGEIEGDYKITLPRHGVHLMRAWKIK
jgi:alpha-galactosidase